jgi:hypothetical protein
VILSVLTGVSLGCSKGSDDQQLVNVRVIGRS